MQRVLLLIPIVTVLCAAQFATRKPSDEFVGAWKLVTYERRSAKGEITYPMGENPAGRLTYDALGRMSAQIMRLGRPDHAADGYVAYYGTFTVEEANHTVIHHVEASLYPDWVGTDLRRQYEFSGDRLILLAKNGLGGPGTETRLVWERAR